MLFIFFSSTAGNALDNPRLSGILSYRRQQQHLLLLRGGRPMIPTHSENLVVPRSKPLDRAGLPDSPQELSRTFRAPFPMRAKQLLAFLRG